MKIPYNKLYLTGNEIEYINKALESGNIAGDGVFDARVCDFLRERLDVEHVLTTTSGSHALELAVYLAGIGPGDEVIMPSYTFPSTANAVLLRGGTPVFCDVDPETLCLDLSKAEEAITKKTKAILPVHYGGVCCPMDTLADMAKEHGLAVIEDAAQALDSSYKGKKLGTWGDFGCYSFHGTKNLVSGEGGAVSINKPGEKQLEMAEIYRQKGTNRTRFIKGEVNRYEWVGEGSSYAPSDLLMAVLFAQLEQMDTIQEKRASLFRIYQTEVGPMVEAGLLAGMSRVPEHVVSNHHNFYILFQDQTTRERVQDKLQREGIGAVIHFVPLHEAPMGKNLGYKLEDFPVTRNVGACLLRLPLFTGMEMQQVVQVAKVLGQALEDCHGC